MGGLGGWLNPEVRDFGSDEENIREYVRRLPEESADALVQGKAYLKLSPFPWQYIVTNYNRYFPDEESTKQWFASILKMIEEEKAKA